MLLLLLQTTKESFSSQNVVVTSIFGLKKEMDSFLDIFRIYGINSICEGNEAIGGIEGKHIQCLEFMSAIKIQV